MNLDDLASMDSLDPGGMRSKIDDRWPVKLIHTVRGIGYMLDLTDKPTAAVPESR